MLTLKGRNEEKVKFWAEHLKREVEKMVEKDVMVLGPGPAPLVRAETFYRYQVMLRTQRMSALSKRLAELIQGLVLPEDVLLTVDIDPTAMA